MVGTSNLNAELDDFSNTNILVVKVDAGLNMEWMREYSREYQSFGIEIQEISTGYLIGATMRTYGQELDMLAMKINFEGDL